MTMIFYGHPLSSYCWKVLIALYETGASFEWRQLDWDNEAVQAEFASRWPLAKMPLLVDGTRDLVESSVIIEYLGQRHPGATPLIPPDPDAALEVRLLDRVFDNYVMTPMQAVVFDRIRPDGSHDPYGVAAGKALIDKARSWLEGRLAGRTWAAGAAFSLADCAAAPSLHYAEKVQPSDGRFPTVDAYLARLEARPSFARVLEEAVPYAHMFPQEA
jgi:glutathione S-transferase